MRAKMSGHSPSLAYFCKTTQMTAWFAATSCCDAFATRFTVREHRLVKLELDGTPAAVREQLITKALDALGVQPLPASLEQVRMFLTGGAVF